MMSKVFLQDMHGSLKRLMEIQKQIASQKMYNKPSDNPSEVARGMAVGTSLAKNEQFQRNMEDAVSWLSNTDKALNQITDIITAIREKVIYACNGALSSTDRDAIAKDIEALRDELVQTANFDVEGRHLLSGFDTATPAFSKSGDGTVAYQGDDGRIQFQIEKGETGLVSLNGRDVFPLGYTRHSVTSIELPMDFRWSGSSENLRISVGDRTVQVALPQRWSDNNQDSLSDNSDYDGFRSPGEPAEGYTLDEIARLVNAFEGASHLVHASVETDVLSGIQRLVIKSLTGEPLQIASIKEATTRDTGQWLSSDAVDPALWNASSDGKIILDFGSGEPVEVSVAAGDTLEDVASSLSMVEGVWAGARGYGTITIVGENLTGKFTASATGGATDLFGSITTSKSIEVAPDISNLGLSSFLGLETYALSTQVEASSVIGDTTVEPLDIILSSGTRRLNLKIGDDSTLTLDDLANRLKAAAGDWLEVVVESDQPEVNLTDGTSVHSETGTQRLLLKAKDGSPLAIFDKNGSYAKSLGLESALTTSDLTSVTFPVTAPPDVPLFIGVEVGESLYRVKLYQRDIALSDGTIDPQALALQIRKQVGEDLLGVESVQSGSRLALHSITGEPVRIIDLSYSDPSLKGMTSGFAMAAGLHAGVTGEWIPPSYALVLDTPTGGTYRLGNDETGWSADIAYDADADAVRGALEVVYGAGSVAVAAGGDGFSITFAAGPVKAVELDSSLVDADDALLGHSALAAGSESSFTICTGGRSITVSVGAAETIEDVASRVGELAGGWLDVSLASDGSGNMRLALAAKDGSPVNIYDVTGIAAKDFGFNTDLGIKAGIWAGGGEMKISVDGYELVMDLRDETTLQGIADNINMRFPGSDVKACVVGSGADEKLVLYSPNGKYLEVEPPAGMTGDTATPSRSAGGPGGPMAQTVTVRRGADVEEADIFAILDDLIASVKQGDTEGLSLSFLPKLDQGIDDALRARAFCGAIQRRYDISQSRLKSNNIAMTDLHSSIMDVDLAEASIEFQTAQMIYQATLSTISKVVQPTLVDYLS